MSDRGGRPGDPPARQPHARVPDGARYLAHALRIAAEDRGPDARIERLLAHVAKTAAAADVAVATEQGRHRVLVWRSTQDGPPGGRALADWLDRNCRRAAARIGLPRYSWRSGRQRRTVRQPSWRRRAQAWRAPSGAAPSSCPAGHGPPWHSRSAPLGQRVRSGSVSRHHWPALRQTSWHRWCSASRRPAT